MRGVAAGRGLMLCVLLVLGSSTAMGATIVYNDLTVFQAATGATAEAPLQNVGLVPSGTITFGDMTYSLAPGGTQLFVGTQGVGGVTNNDWSLRLSGPDIAISNLENINVVETTTAVYSLGFQFHEPQFDPNLNAAFVDSTFTVTLVNGVTPVGAFTFNAPNDTAAFVGVWSTDAFNRVEIRETIGGAGNEFYGQFYTGTNALVVPLPAVAGAGAVLLCGFGASRGRRRADPA